MTSAAAAVRLEWRHLRRDRALWALLTLYALLVLGAAASGRAVVDARAADAQRALGESTAVEQSLARQASSWAGTGKPPVAVQPGPVAFSVLPAWVVRPPAAYAPLAIGQSDLLADRYAVTARPAHTFLARPELASPAALAMGSLDVAFLVLFGLPIVIVAIAFDIGSREREAGTLAVAVAQGVPAARFVGAKWAARATVTLAVLVAALLLAAAIATVGRIPSGARGPALAAWLAIAVGYAAFWFALALYVNSRGAASDRNGVALTGAWVALVIVAPALTALLATALFPPPSRVELAAVLREAAESADRAAAEARDRFFFDHPELSGQEVDPDEFYRAVAATEAVISREVAPALAAFDAQAARQQRLVDALQYLSPATIAQRGLLAAAGTDGAGYARFRAQVEAFHGRWRAFFVSRLERGARLTAADYAALPRFEYRAPSAAEQWRGLAVPLAALYGAAVLLAWLAWRRLKRQPVV